MEKQNKITKFEGKYAFLSNMYKCRIVWKELEYPSVENAYQATKTKDFYKKKIFQSISPVDSKRKGRQLELRSDWEKIKLEIMEKLLLIKFKNNPELGKKLLETQNIELIEENTWGDTFWGIYEGKGENNLGKLLMKIRKIIRDEENDKNNIRMS